MTTAIMVAELYKYSLLAGHFSNNTQSDEHVAHGVL